MTASLLYSESWILRDLSYVSVSTCSRADNMMSEPNLEG